MQLPGCEGQPIRERVLLEAPSFHEWTGIKDIKLELVEIGHRFFCSGVTSAYGTRATMRKGGKASRLCPGNSDVDLFGYGESVINLNAEIPDCALDLVIIPPACD